MLNNILLLFLAIATLVEDVLCLDTGTTEGKLTIAGVAVGCVAVFLTIVGICCYCDKKDKKRDNAERRAGAVSAASSDKSRVIASTQFVQPQAIRNPRVISGHGNGQAPQACVGFGRQASAIQQQPIFPPASPIPLQYNSPLQVQTTFHQPQPQSHPSSLDGRSPSYSINTPSTIQATSPSPTPIGLQHQESFRNSSQPQSPNANSSTQISQNSSSSTASSQGTTTAALEYQESIKVPRIQTKPPNIRAQQRPESLPPNAPQLQQQDSFRVPRLQTSFQPPQPKVQHSQSFTSHQAVSRIRVLPQAPFTRADTQDGGNGIDERASARNLPKHMYKNPFGFPEDGLENRQLQAGQVKASPILRGERPGSAVYRDQDRPPQPNSIIHMYSNMGTPVQIALPNRRY